MPPETLHIATLSLCIFTLILATAALMPQLKRAMVLARDVMLMSTLVVGLSFAGFVGWGKVFEIRERRQQESAQTQADQSFAIGDLFDSDHEELDPLPLPTAEDEIARLRPIQPQSQFRVNRSTTALHATDNRGWDK